VKNNYFFLSFVLFILNCIATFSQNLNPKTKISADTTFIRNLLLTQKEKFEELLNHAVEYRLQIVYSQINRDSHNFPHLSHFSFRSNPNEYFYPASLVKIPLAVIALEKLNDLNIPELDKYTRLKIDSAYTCQSTVISDASSPDGFPSIAHYIKKMFLVSDNDAYNHLYEFTGPELLNQRLASLSYKNARITHRFKSGCDTLSNRYTNPFTFLNSKNEIIYQQPMSYYPVLSCNPNGATYLGKGYLENGKYIAVPMDFTYSNNLPLKDIHKILISIIFSETMSDKKRFRLNEDDYKFLYKYMSMYPRESTKPAYPFLQYKDSYKKYIYFGSRYDTISDTTIRIFNHVGLAYGFMSDCAYFVDFSNKVEFFLSAVIYVNKNEIINDGIYEYEKTAQPFFENLGKLFYEFEIKREKKFLPDLGKFGRGD